MKCTVQVPVGKSKTKVEAPRKKRTKWPFQGYIDFQGLKIDVENKKGSVRKGKDPDGKPWSTFMHHHYGEIRGTEGVDGDRLDCYVGPFADSPLVVVVHQQNPETRKYDEDKVMLGFEDVQGSLQAYRKQYNRKGFYQSHTKLNIGQFWRWVHDREKQGKKVKQAEDSVVAPGLAVGAGVGAGAGLRGYFTHKGMWDVANQELAGKGKNLADAAEKIYKSKVVDKGPVHRFFGKHVFGAKGPDVSQLRNLSLGRFPASRFREAAVKGGLMVGVPAALGTMLALKLMKGGKPAPYQLKTAGRGPKLNDLRKAYAEAARKYYDVINQAGSVKKDIAGIAGRIPKFFRQGLPAAQTGIGLGAGGLAAGLAAYAAPDTKYDLPAAAGAGIPVALLAGLLSRKPLARAYLRHADRGLGRAGAKMGKLWEKGVHDRSAVDYGILEALRAGGKRPDPRLYAGIRARGEPEREGVRKILQSLGDDLGRVHEQQAKLKLKFGG